MSPQFELRIVRAIDLSSGNLTANRSKALLEHQIQDSEFYKPNIEYKFFSRGCTFDILTTDMKNNNAQCEAYFNTSRNIWHTGFFEVRF